MENKIIINLNKLDGIYFQQEKEVFKQYLQKSISLNTVNDIIEIVTEKEFLYYVEEEFTPRYVYNTHYKKITQERFLDIQEKGVIPEEIKYSEGMYINFEYKNGKYVNDQLGEDYLKQNIPGLFHFNNNIITYYFLDGNEVYLDPDYT